MGREQAWDTGVVQQDGGMRLRLSALMFLQYAVAGAWVPLFSLNLQELRFTPGEIAWASSTAALGALLAPLPWGQVADRWVASEKCISFCALVCGALLWVLSELRTPWPIFWVSLAFWLFMVPVLSLGTALTLRHLERPKREFGPVRMWGTVGWACVNWCLGCWFTDADFVCGCLAYLRPANPVSELADAYRLGGMLAFVLGLYALTLPHTPPSPRRPAEGRWGGRLVAALEAPLYACQLLRQRSFLVFCICWTGLCCTVPFSTQMTPLLLQHLGVAKTWLPATLTIAQSLEVATLGLLPVILMRQGIERTLLLGVISWTIALTILALGAPAWLVISSLGLHGLYITCWVVTGQVWVHRLAPWDVRASAQALLQFLNGAGLLAGHLLVGWIRSASPGGFVPAFGMAALLSATLVCVFMLGFRAREEKGGKKCGTTKTVP